MRRAALSLPEHVRRCSQGSHQAALRRDHAPEQPSICPDLGKAFCHKPCGARTRVRTDVKPHVCPDRGKACSGKFNLVSRWRIPVESIRTRDLSTTSVSDRSPNLITHLQSRHRDGTIRQTLGHF